MNITRYLLAFGGLIALVSPLIAADEKPVTHSFVAATFMKNQVLIVSADGKVEWEFEAPACMDVWKLPNGNILVASRAKGILEVNRDKKVVWSFKPEGETYTCQRLANGRTLVGDNRNKRLVEVDAEGKIQREIKIESNAKEHGMIRTARALPGDHFLVCQREDNVVREYDLMGKVVWEFKISGPMTAIRLANGNTLMSSVSGEFVEADAKGQVVWKLAKTDFPGGGKGKPYGLQRLPNGNTIACLEGSVYEFTPEKKLVWSRADPFLAGLMCVQLLDVPGDATKGEVLR